MKQLICIIMLFLSTTLFNPGVKPIKTIDTNKYDTIFLKCSVEYVLGENMSMTKKINTDTVHSMDSTYEFSPLCSYRILKIDTIK